MEDIALILTILFGLGSSSHSGLFHYIYSFGAVWCGIFCAGIFSIGAGMLSLLVIGSAGRGWISEHSGAALTPWISFLFFVGMLVNDSSSSMHHASVTYYVSWFLTAIVLSLFFSRFGRILLKTR